LTDYSQSVRLKLNFVAKSYSMNDNQSSMINWPWKSLQCEFDELVTL